MEECLWAATFEGKYSFEKDLRSATFQLFGQQTGDCGLRLVLGSYFLRSSDGCFSAQRELHGEVYRVLGLVAERYCWFFLLFAERYMPFPCLAHCLAHCLAYCLALTFLTFSLENQRLQVQQAA